MATLNKEQLTQLRGVLGALLLAADGPLKGDLLVDLLNGAADDEEWPFRVSSKLLEDTLYAMQLDYDGERGIELVSVSGGWRFRTSPNYSEIVRRLWPERKVRLSKAALEALAVIAYRQPCTRLDVESVRGVDCGGVVRSLLERGLVRIVGKKDEPGRPLLYGTTSFFLETFSMDDLSTLPTLRALDDLESEEAAKRAFETDPAFAERYAAAMSSPPPKNISAPDTPSAEDSNPAPSTDPMSNSVNADSTEEPEDATAVGETTPEDETS